MGVRLCSIPPMPSSSRPLLSAVRNFDLPVKKLMSRRPENACEQCPVSDDSIFKTRKDGAFSSVIAPIIDACVSFRTGDAETCKTKQEP